MIKGFETIAFMGLIFVLVAVYFATFNFAYQGYGYPGYRGYHRMHHSRWYRGRHDYTYYPSVRETSPGGSHFSRRGINGGK